MRDTFDGIRSITRAYSGIFYDILAIVLFLLWIALSISAGPGGAIVLGPTAMLALILRKLDQIYKNR